MEVINLLSDKKYTKIVHFLKSISITDTNDLSKENVSKIMFIPGVDMSTLLEAKVLLFAEANKEELLYPEIASTDEFIDDGSRDSLIERTNYERMDPNGLTVHSDCRLALGSTLSDIPRSHYFIGYCHSKGIHYLDEIDDSILDGLESIRGIGVTTALLIKNRIKESIYYMNEIETNNIDNLSTSNIEVGNDILIATEFKELYKGKRFVDFCFSKGYIRLSDLVGFPFDTTSVKGISLDAMLNLKKHYLSLIKNRNFSFEIKDVHPMYDLIPIKHIFGNKFGTMNAISNKEISTREFVKNASAYDYTMYYSFFENLDKSPINIFEEKLNELKNSHYTCLLERSNGKTLQAIGNSLGITRERVRQIAKKCVCDFRFDVDMISIVLSAGDTKPFTTDDIRNIGFTNVETRQIYEYVLKESETSEFVCLKFTDLIIPQDMIPVNYELILKDVLEDIVSDGIDYENMVNLASEELGIRGLSFLSPSNIDDYLIFSGYNIFGKFVTRRKPSYALVCLNAIEEYFDFDIKLDSDENNPDLIKLRRIMDEHYKGVMVGKTNRALSTRLMNYMILTARGRYCPPSKLAINKKLFNEIFEFIISSEQDSFYFAELFEIFREELSTTSRVDNRFILQGVLKYLYSDYFYMDKDTITKIGSNKESIDSRIISKLIATGRGMSIQELTEEIPGLSSSVLAFIIARNKNIINWGSKSINHIYNIKIDFKLEEICRTVIDLYCEDRGYISSYLLFDVINRKNPTILVKHGINSSERLYYVIQYLIGEVYNVTRSPHILANNVLKVPTSYEIIKHYTMQDNLIHKDRIDSFTNEFKWTSATISIIFDELDKEYIRISDKEYYLVEALTVTDSFIEEFDHAISELVGDYSFYPIVNIYDFSKLPKIQFSWNQHVISSIIDFYSGRFAIVIPKAKDRRYMRSIIVMKGLYKSYEDFIIKLIKKNNYDQITEYDLKTLLIDEGLIAEKIPNELYYGEKISYNGDVFILL